jgi:hypothetical protein
MQTTIKLIQKSIPQLRPAKIEDIFISTTLTEYEDLLVQLSEDTWPDIVDRVREIEVTFEDPRDTSFGGLALSEAADDASIGPPDVTTSSRSHQGMP